MAAPAVRQFGLAGSAPATSIRDMHCLTARMPAEFQPVPADLVRLGSDHDGGYVVARRAIEASTHLLSFGLETNWSFETDYLRLKQSTDAFTGIDAYDPTLTRWLYVKRSARRVGRRLRGKRVGHMDSWSSYRKLFGTCRVQHHRQWIGRCGAPNTVDFADCLRRLPESAQVFLKMDIEGSEYDILDQVSASHQRLTGIAMELHAFAQARAAHQPLFKQLHRHFRVVHVHVNNYGRLDEGGCPNLVEVNYLHDRLVGPLPGGAVAKPDQLDQPNRPGAPDYAIEFEPQL